MLAVTTRNVVASAARTTTGNSGQLSHADANTISLLLNVTAVSGTPSMVLSVEWSTDGTNFAKVDTTPDVFAAVTAAGAVVKQFPTKAPYYRVVWTISGGTPSVTFTVDEYAARNF
jgi:hypothetical protein